MQQEPKLLPLDEPASLPTIRLQRRTMIVWAVEQVYRGAILSRTPPRLTEPSYELPLRGPLLVTFTGHVTVQDLPTLDFPALSDAECGVSVAYAVYPAPKESYKIFGARLS